MLLYDHSRAFEYLVNFELVDLVGSLSQMDIHLFIERGARQCIPRPARRAIGLPSLSLILLYLLIYLGLKRRKVSLGNRSAAVVCGAGLRLASAAHCRLYRKVYSGVAPQSSSDLKISGHLVNLNRVLVHDSRVYDWDG
jgi:hypothetical protein